jgi:phage terminase large subunit-like protein
MARHLANAIVKASSDGRYKYISKDHPDSPRKIDLAVAGVVAHHRALHYLGQTGEPMIAFL